MKWYIKMSYTDQQVKATLQWQYYCQEQPIWQVLTAMLACQKVGGQQNSSL